MTTTTTTGADPRILLGKALDQMDAVLAALPPDRLDRPTPCVEYDVRTLTRHVLSVLRRIRLVATGGDPFDVPSIAPDESDAGLLTAYRAARAELDETWADDAVLDRMLRVPWGEVPGRAAAMAYVQELTMHAWDLAVPVERLDLLDSALAEAALGIATQFLPAEPRGGQIPFGPVVAVPETADAYQRLAGWLGRQP